MADDFSLVTSKQLENFGNRVKDKLDQASSGDSESSQEIIPNSNQNLIDNWYFLDAVNQRGLSSYNGTGTGLNRWHTIKTGNSYGYIYEYGKGIRAEYFVDDCGICQNLSGQILFAGTYTLSCLSTIGIKRMKVFNGSNILLDITYPNPTKFSSAVFTVSQNLGGTTQVMFYHGAGANGVSNYIQAVKLEHGNVQTLVKIDSLSGNYILNDTPPDPRIELLKCTPYFDIIKPITSGVVYGLGVATSKNTILFNIPTKSTFVRNPQMSYTAANTFNIFYFNNTSLQKITPTSLFTYYATSTSIGVGANISGTANGSYTYQLRDSSFNSYIMCDTEWSF